MTHNSHFFSFLAVTFDDEDKEETASNANDDPNDDVSEEARMVGSKQSDETVLRVMKNLQTLTWTRIDVIFRVWKGIKSNS